MHKILITGGAGFIGTALAYRLSNAGYIVSLLDLPNKFTKEHKCYETFAIDIREYKNFLPLSEKRFDYIYHLAGQTSSLISQEDPENDVETNVRGTLNICTYARSIQVKKIIFSSSMATYGNHPGVISESCEQKPISNYGVSKKSAEAYIQSFLQYGIKYTIFRIFNAYGPGQDMGNLKQGMASIFMAQVICDDVVKVTGSLERYRDFIYIDDVVDALEMALSEKMDCEVFNLGSGIKTTVSELIQKIIDISDKKNNRPEIVNIGSHDGDQFGSVADIQKLKQYGWEPRVSFDDGLYSMYQYALEVLR